jgi:predicted ribosomally synthesized peptide with SipW-like signal peptide
MTDRTIELTRRNVLAGLTAVGAAGVAGAGGTFALLSDTEASDNNTLSVGTLNLTTNGNESATTTLNASEVGTGTSGSATLTVNNTGTLDGRLNFGVSAIRNLENGLVNDAELDDPDENGGSPGELSQYVSLRLGYDNNDNGNLNSSEAVVDGSLDGMKNVQFNPNVSISAAGSKDFVIEWEIDEDAGSEVQSDSVEIDFDLELLERAQGADVVLTGDTPYGQGAGFSKGGPSGTNPWDTTTDSGTPDIAHRGSGAWGTVDHSSTYSEYKQGFYFAGDFSAISTLSGYTVDEIAEISYWLYEPNPLNGNDIYLLIYTRPEGDGNDGGSFYDSRLVALPTNANGAGSPNFTPGEWNKFSTRNSASNTLVFDDSGHKSGNSIGGPVLPTLSDLRSGSIDWTTYDSSLSSTFDYRNQEVLALSLQTNSTSPELQAWIDDIVVKLTTGETLTIDLEP